MVTRMEIQKSFNQEKDKTSKIEILKRASGNIDNKNLIRRYLAIRQISGSINGDANLLCWLIDNHNDFLKDVAGKLRLVIKKEKDGVMISEAVRYYAGTDRIRLPRVQELPGCHSTGLETLSRMRAGSTADLLHKMR